MTDLEGKTAIVTGASSGIGEGIAERLGRDGANVVVNYRGDAAEAERVVAAITAAGGRAEAVRADVSAAAEVERLFAACAAAFGPPDILVANAGMGALEPLPDFNDETFDRIYGLNVRGTLHCLKQAALTLRDDGRIVLIGSSSEVHPWPGTAVYASSKAAVRKLTEIAAVELGPRRITVNCVIPGIIDTPMSRQLPREALQPVVDASPWKRIGTPADIAGVVAFLCGDDAVWLTGQSIVANGGSGY